MQRNSTDVAGGIQWISDMHDDIVEHFLKLRDDVHAKRGFPSFGEDLDRQIAAYVDGLGAFSLNFRMLLNIIHLDFYCIGQWIRGHDEWNFGSGRYVLSWTAERFELTPVFQIRYFGNEGLEIQKTRKVIIA